MKALRTGLLSLVLLTGLTAPSFAAIYQINTPHSMIGFSVKHLTVSEVQGNFKTFSGTVTLDDKNMITAMEATIDTKSINTQNDGRDNHLRGPDFFDADKNPTITFKSKNITGGDGAYTVSGDLTIKDVTKEITIPMTIFGPVTNPMGGEQVIGISGQTKINRQDYGVNWNKQMDQGGLVVSDDVVLNITLEAHAQ